MTSVYQRATCARSTSAVSFRPQTSQNTALVVEHRCLYTYDHRRKAKRWQDGFLRFHTFNKRIMIYDVPRNYIGDTHWREEQPIQDGDELELDRPILVQVGEHLESLEQDITALLEKRHKNDCVRIEDKPKPNGFLSPTPMTGNMRTTGSVGLTGLRPKSLNALLGKPQGTIGKASLPTKSPYEVRKAAECGSKSTEPPAKKARIEAPTTCRGNPDSVNQTCILEVPSNDEQPTTFPGHGPKSRLARSNATVDATPRPNVEPRLSDIELSVPFEDSREVDREAPQVRRPSRPEGQSSILTPQESQETSAQKRPSKSSETMQILFHPEATVNSSNEQSKARSKLRVASRKPRKKLMYRDLLPPNMSCLGDVSKSANLENERAVVKPASSRRNRLSSMSLPQWDYDEQNRWDNMLQNFDPEVGERTEGGPSTLEQNCCNHDRPSDSSGSERSSATQHAKWDIRGGKLPSTDAIKPTVSQANCVVPYTDFALAKMDEILLLQSQPQQSAGVAKPQPYYDISHIQQRPLPSCEPKLNAPTLRISNPARDMRIDQEMRASPCQSNTGLVASQPSQTRLIPFPRAQQFHTIKGNQIQSGNYLAAGSPKLPSFENTIHAIPSGRDPSLVVVSPKPKCFGHRGTIASPGILQAAKDEMGPTNVTTFASVKPPPTSQGITNPSEVERVPSPETSIANWDSAKLQDTSTKAVSNGYQATNAVTSLPPFKPPYPTKVRRRSPIQKSVSDTPAVTGAREAPSVGNATTKVSDTNYVKEQVANPWSREAWDLFGCGRDGMVVDFRTFCLNEGA